MVESLSSKYQYQWFGDIVDNYHRFENDWKMRWRALHHVQVSLTSDYTEYIIPCQQAIEGGELDHMQCIGNSHRWRLIDDSLQPNCRIACKSVYIEVPVRISEEIQRLEDS